MSIQPNTHQESPQILMVEDSPTQAEKLKHLLEEHNYRVLLAENGKRALAMLAENIPALIISDIVMPEMNGYELCRRTKTDPRTANIPVILLTSLSKTDDVLEGLECGADYFITKPYRPVYLLKSIEQILLNRNLRKDKRVRIGAEIMVGGKPRLITTDQQQALSLLISTYEAAVHTNTELIHAQEELAETNRGLLALSMELEARVAQRTEQLEEANRNLRLALDQREAAFVQVESLASFPQQNPHPILRVSIQGKVLETNPTAAPILAAWGCATGEPVPDKWQETIAAIYASGVSRDLDLTCASSVFAVTFAPVAGTEYVNLYAHDITQRKKAEAALQRELEVNTTLTRLSRELISHPGGLQTAAFAVLEQAKAITGSEHGLVSAIDQKTGENVCHTFTAMMGQKCQVAGEGRRIAFPPAKNGQYPALWGHALNTRESFFTNSPRQHPQAKGLPAGHIPINQYLSVPVMLGTELVGQIALANPGREYDQPDLRVVEGLAGLYALIVQRERGEEEKKQLEKYLRQAQKMEAAGTLAGGIAHDFNNILAAMIGYVNLTLHEVEVDSRAKHNLEQVLKASRRARDLIRQILAFSRRTEQAVQPLNICPVVKEALKLLRATLPSTIEIAQDVPAELDSVLAEPGQIHQIMMNLCTNAAHAMKEKGGVLKVELTTHIMHKKHIFLKPDLRPGPYVKLSVRDTGHGIDPANVDRIFEPYFTTKEAQEGTGLGLSVVHGIVKNFGGEVTVYSELGAGTVFNVYLPAIVAAPHPEAEETPLALGNGERVLFVDDEKMLIDVGSQALRRLGYEVKAFDGSLQALEAFKANPTDFDLVITDFNMPKMTGVQLISEMRKIRPDIPIIVCSGFSEHINENNIAEFGVDAFLMKPLYDNELAGAISNVLEKAAEND